MELQQAQEPVEIIQGGAATLDVTLRDELGDPFSLVGASAVQTCFKRSDGTSLSLSLGSGVSIVNALLGKLQVALTAAQTALLQVVEYETLELTITLAGPDPIKVQIDSAYSVKLAKC